jgi:hypothetical protein
MTSMPNDPPPDPSRRLLLQCVSAVSVGVVRPPWAQAQGQAEPQAQAHEPTGDLLAESRRLLIDLQSPELAPFLEEWPGAPERRRVVPSTIPALHWLTPVQQGAPRFSSRLIHALVGSAQALAWRRSYSPALVGGAFYDNYGYTEFAGLTGPVPSDHLACGVLLLGPHLTYPPHRHEADEIYVPLAGTARWKHGTGDWTLRPPGAVIHHARHEPHAMQTDATPLLAFYLWRSANLAQSSHLDAPSAATHKL